MNTEYSLYFIGNFNNERKEVLTIFQNAIDRLCCLQSLARTNKYFYTILSKPIGPSEDYKVTIVEKQLKHICHILQSTAVLKDIHTLTDEYATCMYPLYVQNKALNELDVYTKHPKILFLLAYAHNEIDIRPLIYSALRDCLFLKKNDLSFIIFIVGGMLMLKLY